MITKQEIQRATIAVILVLVVFSGVALAQLAREQSSWDRFSAAHDENGDGQITAEEFGRTDRRFQHLDSDGDGAVTPEELQATLDRFGGPPTPGRGLAAVADRDEDGQVTREEWESTVAEIDTDGDGVIGDEEMAGAILRHHAETRSVPGPELGPGPGGGPGPRRGFGPGPMIERLDADDDGVLEIGDFDTLFSTLDADGNGILVGEEMHQAWSRRGPRGGRFHHRRSTGAEAGFGSRPDFGGPVGPGHRHLQRADRDGDGSVTLDEWDAMLDRFDRQAIFDALDADGDQVISSEEMAAARPRRGSFPPRD